MRYLVMPAMAVLLPVIIIWSMTTPAEKMSIEWQLAVVNAEDRIPEHHLSVFEFAKLLDSLERKCSNSRSEIAEVSMTAHAFLKERGSLSTLMEFTTLLDKSIPENMEKDVRQIVQDMVGQQ
jgi:hypothetical protein